MTDIAPRVVRTDRSLTLQISAEAAALEQAGERVVRLGAGEPDFDTPEPIKRAAIQAIEDGATHYRRSTAAWSSSVPCARSSAAITTCASSPPRFW